MTVTEFVTHLEGVKDTAKGYSARCPAHGDRHNSLSVAEGDDGRTLLKDFAGCTPEEIVEALGLTMADLFDENASESDATVRTGPRRPERTPSYYWNWRKQCAELERLIQINRERAEAILQATHGLEVHALPAPEFDEVMDLVGRAYDWLARCERLDETLFGLQQDWRAEEQAIRKRKKTRKLVLA